MKLAAANGYEDFVVAALPTGGLDSGSDDRWEIGGTAGANTYIEAAFTASGAGFSFDTVVMFKWVQALTPIRFWLRLPA